jgi:hypothetical protein
MRKPLRIGLDPQSGWWLIAPLSDAQGDLHDCDLLRVSLETTDIGTGIAVIDISIPGVDNVLRLYFETSSAVLKLDDLDGVPSGSFGEIAGTDFAQPDWFSLQALRCDLEMHSGKQFYEWVERQLS